MFRKAGSKEEANLAIALSNLGGCIRRERFDEALARYQESLEDPPPVIGEARSRYAAAKNNLANCLRK